LDKDPAVLRDRKRLRAVKAIPMSELCAANPGRSRRAAGPKALALRPVVR
jgi:hypothetical protein